MNNCKIIFLFFFPKVRIHNNHQWKKVNKYQGRKYCLLTNQPKKEKGIEQIHQENACYIGHNIGKSNMNRKEKYRQNNEKINTFKIDKYISR